MKNTFLSLVEVSSLLGAGLSTVKRHVKDGKFITRQVPAKGGKCGLKYEIALSSLPIEAQKKYRNNSEDTATVAAKMAIAKIDLQESTDKSVLHSLMQKGIREYISLTSTGKKRADAKTTLLVAFDRFCQIENLNGRKAVESFCHIYNGKEMAIEGWVKQLIPSISPSTLYNWSGILKNQGAGSLAGGYGNRKGHSIIEQQSDVLEFLICMVAEKTHVSNATLHKAMWGRFSSRTDITLPSKESVGRWRKQFMETNAELMTAISNPDEWKNKYLVAYGDSKFDIERPNQRWLLDSSPADVMLTDGRHSLIAMLDVYTSRILLFVSKTSTAEAITLLIRRGILAFGMFETIKTDNGKDYASHRLDLAVKMLGGEQLFSQPFSPWEKGQVERIFRTFQHGVFELLPGFVGHNVSDKKALEARTTFADRLFKKNEVIEMNMSSTEFQKFCDSWTADVYDHTPSAGLDGKTPFQMYVGYSGKLKVIEDERVLDLLLAEAPGDGFCTVNKKGIRLRKEDYVSPDLSLYAGQKVQVRFNPSDMGRIYVYAYDRPEDPFNPQAIQPGFHFVCEAICHKILGINPQEVAAKARQIQKENVQQARKAVKSAARKLDLGSVVDEVLAASKAANSTVVQFPKQTVIHQSKGISAATAALSFGSDDTEPTKAELHDIADRLVDLKIPDVQRPLFDSADSRALWLVEQWMEEKEIGIDEQDFLSGLWLSHSMKYQMILDVCQDRYGNSIRYAQLKKAVGWQ